MDTALKRQKLREMCRERLGCLNCPLSDSKKCRCTSPYDFSIEPKKMGYITDAEVIGAYEIVFGEDKPQSIELEQLNDDFITISNVNKIQSISIYFKED